MQRVSILRDLSIDFAMQNQYKRLAKDNTIQSAMPHIEEVPEGGSGLPEWMSQKTIRDVTLDITVGEIPDGPTCTACGLPTEKKNVLYVCGDDLIVQAKQAPGYRCPRDGLEYYSDHTLLKFYEKSRDILRAAGMTEDASALDAALAAAKERVNMKKQY